MNSLETVILSKNKLYTTIPSWIGKWTNLEHLSLDGNGLYGTIPSALGSFQKLKYLKLDTNPQLQGRTDGRGSETVGNHGRAIRPRDHQVLD